MFLTHVSARDREGLHRGLQAVVGANRGCDLASRGKNSFDLSECVVFRSAQLVHLAGCVDQLSLDEFQFVVEQLALLLDLCELCLQITIISVELSDAELTARRKAWKAPPYKFTRGTLYKYIKNVKSASEGCVTDE